MARDLISRITRKRYNRIDLAALLGVHPSSVDRWIHTGRIEYDLAEGRRKFFSSARVVRFVREDYTSVDRAGASAERVDA